MDEYALKQLASLFFETRQIIRAHVRGTSADTNTWLRLETMRYIHESNDPTMHDIASYLRVKAPSATSLIRHLEREGMIERRSAANDKRLVRIYLTRSGLRDLNTYRKRSRETMQRVFAKLRPGDIEALAAILGRVRDMHRPEQRSK